MTAERQQFSLALGLSAGVNGLLFLFIAWSMAVDRGLSGNRWRKTPEMRMASMPTPAVPEIVMLTLSAEPEQGTGTAPEKEMILSPDGQTESLPPDPASRFISNANMRAASEEAPSPDGIAGLATQQGLDKPFLDLRDSDFRDGETEANRPPEPGTTPDAMPPPPVPESGDPPPDGNTPPEPAPAPTSPESPNPAPEETTTAADQPPEPETTEAPAPPAFRDLASRNLVPIPTDPPIPQFRRSATPPPRPAPAPRPAIPERVPETAYQSGTKKSKQLGTISNRGQSSVDAVQTAEGKFGKHIKTAIEKGWRRRMLTLAGLANPGLVEVEFEVDPKGRISNVRLANPGEANPVMQDCALSAVIEAKLPPPPPELFEELRDNLSGGRMRCSFSFLIY